MATTDRYAVAQLGALTSDLVAGVFALATEGEIGPHLDQRIRELNATMDALKGYLERIRVDRSRP